MDVQGGSNAVSEVAEVPVEVNTLNPFLGELVTSDNEGTLRFSLCEHGQSLKVLVRGTDGKDHVVTEVQDRAKTQRQIHEAVKKGRITAAIHEVLCFALWHYQYGANGWAWRQHGEYTCRFQTSIYRSPAELAGFLEGSTPRIYEA